MQEIAKIYDPRQVEAQAERIWDQGRYFHADAAGKGPKGSYTIVIPPPNVTAALHLGHALNNTLQDILIRMRRMQGFNTLWMPGTDHAGIATQTVVEKRLLAEQGKRRTDFAREEFVGHVQAWKDEYEAQILGQLKSMGCSCDWDRTRFTMDQICAKAVRTNFFNLFTDGLIYRGKRLVNWDPATQTVLADDEVEHQNVQGFFWYLKYPLETPVAGEGQTIDHVTVATTRPETMLGDTAVAMNPNDPRAKYLVGKRVRLPIVGRLIPIVADDHVVLPNADSADEKAKFSTGFLKVTPAHDPNDWEIGRRHDLPVINVMAPDGSISDKFGWQDAGDDAQFLLGMDRFEAREAIVQWFREENLLEQVRDYAHEVGHSYRSHVPIEPYLSDQWYIAVKKPIDRLTDKLGSGLIEGTDVPVNSLAGLALAPLLEGRVKFYPERYGKTYQTWLENLRDWPISRQLWWGHRIPVWYINLNYSSDAETPDQVLKFQNECVEKFIKAFDAFAQKANIQREYLIQRIVSGVNVYVCTLTQAADNALNAFKRFSESFELEEVKPGKKISCVLNDVPGYPQCNTEALNLMDHILDMYQDPDVLDTWFSSALWPFSTLGWPDETEEVKTFYPTQVLCTAREIITLWVSRMVMMGQYCVGDIPFSDVYIHAMIQDGQGRKMSKSLGNGIDPLVAIDSHGADAMRFTLASMTTDTQDVRMPVAPLELPDGRTVNTSPKFDLGRSFCNKLWNASRFAMMNLEGTDPAAFDAAKMDMTDRWILSRLARAVKATTEALDGFKFNEPINELYRFFWNDFCDWYLEWSKPRMQDAEQRPIAQNVLAFVLDQILRLLHPFVPFITEGIYQNLNEIAPRRGLKGIADLQTPASLIAAPWPERLDGRIDTACEKKIELAQSVIRAIRDIRSQYNIAPSRPVDVSASGPAGVCELLTVQSPLIGQLAGVSTFTISATLEKPTHAAAAIVEEVQLYVHDVIDPAAERQRLQKQKEFIENGLRPLQAKLSNENFVSRAKPEVVEQSRQKMNELAEQLAAVEKHLAELNA